MKRGLKLKKFGGKARELHRLVGGWGLSSSCISSALDHIFMLSRSLRHRRHHRLRHCRNLHDRPLPAIQEYFVRSASHPTLCMASRSCCKRLKGLKWHHLVTCQPAPYQTRRTMTQQTT